MFTVGNREALATWESEREAPPDFRTSPTCAVCTLPKSAVNPWVFQRQTVAHLRDGSDAGCRTCRLRLDAVQHFAPAPETVVTFHGEPQRRLTLDHRTFFEIFKVVDDPGPDGDLLDNIQSGHLLSSSTSSAQTLEIMRTWTSNCLSSHDKCPAPTCSYMPKRVLDVSKGRVVLREGLDPARYACLSHCWGGLQGQIRLLFENMAEFQQQIPWAILSRTFQDAIDVCRKLGIDYIWIDSLCIIQDSEADWDAEAVKMADTYKNALVTIAATKSRDGAGGCYSERDAGHANHRPILDGLVYVRKQMPLFYPRIDDPVRWPLLQRGWVYQEMALSPRVLHFGSEEVIWECRSCRRSESGSNDYDSPARDVRAGLLQSDDPSSPSAWYDIVRDYSRLGLTYDKDKLPALAAITQMVARSRADDDRFLAGMWRRTLLADLFWEPEFRKKASARPANPSIPTWSWASVNSPVQWHSRFRAGSLEPLESTSIIDVVVECRGSPYLGRYSRAELVLRGPLIGTTLRALETSEFQAPSDRAPLEIGGAMRVHQFTADYVHSAAGRDYIPGEAKVFIFPIAIQNAGSHLTYGLALRAKPGVGPDAGVYERIGLVLLACIPSRERGRLLDSNLLSDQQHVREVAKSLTETQAFLATLPLSTVTIV